MMVLVRCARVLRLNVLDVGRGKRKELRVAILKEFRMCPRELSKT